MDNRIDVPFNVIVSHGAHWVFKSTVSRITKNRLTESRSTPDMIMWMRQY